MALTKEQVALMSPEQKATLRAELIAKKDSILSSQAAPAPVLDPVLDQAPAEELGMLEKFSKTIAPASFAVTQQEDPEEVRLARSEIEAINNRRSIATTTPEQKKADEDRELELIRMIAKSGFGKFDQIGKTALGIVSDIGTFTTKTGGAIKAFVSAEDGKGIDDAIAAFQDTEGGIFKGSREESNKFYNEKIKQSEGPLAKAFFTFTKFFAEASIGVIEDPGAIVAAGAKGLQGLGKLAGKAGPDIKSSIAKSTGIEQEALEAASLESLKDIRGAAGTEADLSSEIAAKISPEGERGFLTDLKGEQRKLETQLQAEGVEVPIKQPTIEVEGIAEGVGGKITKEVPDPTKPLIDPKTGEQTLFPVDFLENVGKKNAFSTQFQAQYDKIAKEAEQIRKATKGKATITVKDALKMKQEFQQVLKDKFQVEGKGVFDDVLKGFTASVRATIESSAQKAGKPEYIEIMREIASNKQLFAKSRDVLSGKRADFKGVGAAVAIEKKLSRIMNKFDREPAKILKDLDEIFTKAGIDSDLANKANLAAISRKTQISGKGTPLVSIITTGKGLALPLMMASMGPAGPLRTAAFISGMVGTSPLAARAMFKSINWTKAAGKSPKIKAMINTLGNTTKADAITKLISKIDSEVEKLNLDD